MGQTIPYLDQREDIATILAGATNLYTDLDGTLLGPGGSVLVDDKGNPSIATAAAITRVNSEGLRVVITSGRNRLQLAEVTRIMGWRGFIAEIGCVIVPDRGADPVYYLGDWPTDALEPDETPYAAIARVGALDVLARAFGPAVEHHTPYHLNREATYVLRGNIDVEAVRSDLRSLELPVAIVDNGIIHPPVHGLGDIDEIHAYHLAPAGVSKAGAIAADLKRLGLDAAAGVSIGDSVIDIETASAVALTVAVRNALDDSRVVEAAAQRHNVVATRGRMGAGWAELADGWIAARSS